jgi:hypothetical protein
MRIPPGDLFVGWTWLAGVGVIIFLGVLLLPWFFFLLNLQNLLNQVSPANRKMKPGLVWLNFIPLFVLGWFIYTVIKVRDSVVAEYQTRGWIPDGDLGYNVGLTAGVLLIAGFFISWIPFIGWVLPLAFLVCWIIYWLKTSDLKQRLEGPPAWGRFGAYPPVYPPGYPAPLPPSAGRYPQPYGPQPYGPPGAPGAPGTAPAQPGGPPAAAPLGGAGAEPPTAAAAGAAAAAAGEDTTAETEAREKDCGACGSKIDPGDRFCRSCGLPLPS